MTAVQKFMFDRTFDSNPLAHSITDQDADQESAAGLGSAQMQDEEEIEEEEVQPGFSEQQMEAAKAEAFEAGRQEGVKDASKTVEQDTLNAVRTVGQHITELFGKQEQANNTLMKDGIGVAVTIVRKLFPAMDEASRLDEIDRLVEQTLLRLIEEPRVVVRTHPGLMETLGNRLDGLKAGAGYEGRIILKEDSSFELSDCRLEWGEGSAERNAAMVWQSIDEIIKNTAGIIERIVPDDTMVDVTLDQSVAHGHAQVADATPGHDEAQVTMSAHHSDAPSKPASESSDELPQDIPELAETAAAPHAEKPRNTASSAENDDRGMIAGDETGIVEATQPEQEAAPDSARTDKPTEDDTETDL